jgi:hypothetical protein
MCHKFRLPTIGRVISFSGDYMKLFRLVVRLQRTPFGAKRESATSELFRNFALDTEGSISTMTTSHDCHVNSPDSYKDSDDYEEQKYEITTSVNQRREISCPILLPIWVIS